MILLYQFVHLWKNQEALVCFLEYFTEFYSILDTLIEMTTKQETNEEKAIQDIVLYLSSQKKGQEELIPLIPYRVLNEFSNCSEPKRFYKLTFAAKVITLSV